MQYTILKTRYCLRAFLLVAILACLPGRASASIDECHVSIYFDSEWHEYVENTDVELEPGYYRVRIGRGQYGKSMFNVKYTVDFGDMYANENDTIPETGELEFEIHTGGSVGISWEYYDADGYSDIAGLYVKLVPTPHDEPVVYIEGLSYYVYTKELTDGYSSRTVTWSAQASAGCPGHAYCTVSPSSGTITNGGNINVTDKGGGFRTSTTTVSVYIKQGKPNLALSGSQIKIWYNQPSSDNVYIYYKWSNQSSWTSKLVTGSSAFYISTVDNATISAHVKSTINNYQKDSDNATFTMKSSPTITTSGEPDEDGAGATVTATIRNPNTTGRIKYGYKNLYTNTTFGDYTTSSSSVAVSCSYPYRIWATIVDDRGNAISQTKDYWTLYKLAYPKINGSTASSIMFNEGESFTVSNVATHLGDNSSFEVSGTYKNDKEYDFNHYTPNWGPIELGEGDDDDYGDHIHKGLTATKTFTAYPGDFKTEIIHTCANKAGWYCIPNCDDNSHIYWIRVRLKAPTITLNRTGETVTANTKLREGDSYVVHQNTDHSGYYEAKRFNVSGVNDHTFEAPFYNKTASYTIEEGGNNRWEFRSIDNNGNDYSYDTSDAATINCRYSNVECKEPTASGPSNKYTEGDKITVSCNSAHAARTEYFWETRKAQPASEYQYSTVPSGGLVKVMPGTIIMRNIGKDGYQNNFGTPMNYTYQVMMKTPTSNVNTGNTYTEGDMLTVYSNTQAHTLNRGNYYLRAHFNESNGPTSYQVLSAQNASSLQIQVRPLELSARNIAYTDDFWDSDHTTSGNAYGFYPSNWYDSGGWGDQLKVRMKAPTFYVHGTSTPVTSGMDYDFFEGDVLDVKGNTSITGTKRVLRMKNGVQSSWLSYGDPQPTAVTTIPVVPDYIWAVNEPRSSAASTGASALEKTTDHYLKSADVIVENLNVYLKQPTVSATPTGTEYTNVSNLQITEGPNAALTVHRKSSRQTKTYFKWSDQINWSSTTASTFKIQPRRGVTLSAYAPYLSFTSNKEQNRTMGGTFYWESSDYCDCSIVMKCATPNAMPSRTLLYNDRIELAPSYEAAAATLAWGWDGAAMTSAGSRGAQSLPARLGTLRVKTAKEGYADSDTCTVRYDTFRDRGGVEYQLDAEGEFRVTGANPLTLAAITIPTATAMHDGGREYRVRSIAAGAFTLMDNLAVVAIDNPVPPALDADAFTLAQYDSVRLEVPEALRDVYAAAPVWERFFRQADNLGAGAAGKPYYVKDGTVVFLRRCQSARITQADGRTIYNGPAEAGSRIRLPFGTPVIVNADGQTEKHFTK